MKGRNLFSGFLAAIITVLVVVSLADGYANPAPEPAKVIAWDPDPGTVNASDLEKGIKCRFDKPVDNPEDLKIQVLADGYYPLKGWKVNWLDACTAMFTPGEISYDTGFVLECCTESFSGNVSWEIEIKVEVCDSVGYVCGLSEYEVIPDCDSVNPTMFYMGVDADDYELFEYSDCAIFSDYFLCYQVEVYRFSHELELTSKVVEKSTSGIRQTMNTDP